MPDLLTDLTDLSPIDVDVLGTLTKTVAIGFAVFHQHLIDKQEYLTNDAWAEKLMDMDVIKHPSSIRHITQELRKNGFTIRPKGSKTELITKRGLRKLKAMGPILESQQQLPFVSDTLEFGFQTAPGGAPH